MPKSGMASKARSKTSNADRPCVPEKAPCGPFCFSAGKKVLHARNTDNAKTCRSQLVCGRRSDDGFKCAAPIQTARVTVDHHRWQASSYRFCVVRQNRDHATPVGASLLAMDSSAPRLSRQHALPLTTIAGKPAPTDSVSFERTGITPLPCRSQLAGDGFKCAASIQTARVIVNDHRWQASSHRFCVVRQNRDHATPVGASLLAMDSGAPRLSRQHALSLTTIAGKPAPTDSVSFERTGITPPVGASLLAMDSSAPRLSRQHALPLTTIAGKPAPTDSVSRERTGITPLL
ncbi:hypothetical protein J2Y74_001063 [Pseudomonas migulae]|nr:hypothetical protein [Pseudomonas migulae]